MRDTTNRDQEHGTGTVTNAAPLPFAIQAELSGTRQDGEPVKLIQTADVEGHSPSYLCIDADGKSFWASFSEVRITDPSALPVQSVRQMSRR